MANASFATRLFLVLTLCIALSLSISTAIDYQWAKRDILAEVERLTELTIADTVADVDARINSVETASRLFASILEQRPFSEPGLRSMLRDAVETRTDIFGAAIALDPAWSDGGEGFAPYYFRLESGRLQTADLTQTMDYQAQPWFFVPRDTGQPSWSEPYFDEGGGETLMATYSVPLFRTINDQSQFLGVVTADLALADLSEQLRSFQLGDNGRAILLSQEGRILAAPGKAALTKKLLEVLPESQEKELWRQALGRAMQGEKASFSGDCARIPGDCIVKFSPLQTNGWPLGIIYAEYEMLAPLRAELVRLALTGFGGILLTAIAVSIVSRRLTRPLASLVIATDNIAAGNLDAPMPRARHADEIGRLVNSFSSMQGSLREYIHQLEEETGRRNRLQGELNAAADIQVAMLPDGGKSNIIDERFNLWAYQRPAKSVGGDFYTYFYRGAEELLFAVGDVSDKGIPAALFMARSVTVLEQQVYSELDPGKALHRLNNELVKGNENCMFVTLFYGVVNLRTLQLRFASAGHTAPSLLRSDSCISLDQDNGPALALMEDQEFPLNHIQLKAGDTLAIYTDGIDEAFNEAREQFTTDRLNRLLEAEQGADAAAVGQRIFDAVDKHAGKMQQSDDITCMVFKLPEAGTTAIGETRARTQLVASQGAVTQLLDWVQALSTAWQLSSEKTNDILLLSEEVVSNILKYADLEADQQVTVFIEKESSQIRMTISDPGKPYDPLSEARGASLGQDAENTEIGGLGIHLIKALTAQSSYRHEDGNNILELHVRLSSEPS